MHTSSSCSGKIYGFRSKLVLKSIYDYSFWSVGLTWLAGYLAAGIHLSLSSQLGVHVVKPFLRCLHPCLTTYTNLLLKRVGLLKNEGNFAVVCLEAGRLKSCTSYEYSLSSPSLSEWQRSDPLHFPQFLTKIFHLKRSFYYNFFELSKRHSFEFRCPVPRSDTALDGKRVEHKSYRSQNFYN